MHVLILPSWYPRYDGDAEGSFFRDQAHGLVDAGLEVGVVFPDLRGPRRYFQGDPHSGIAVKKNGNLVEVRSHGFNWFPRNMTGFEWLWRKHADKAFKAYVEKFGKPDIVHAHSMEPAATVAARINERYGIPFVITEHSTFHIRELASCSVRKKCTRLARVSSANLAVSEVFAEKLNAQYGGDWSYLPNIVSPRFLNHPLITPSQGEFRLVSVALLAPRKRMDLVIDAVAQLRRRDLDVTLSIIGDGDERSRLEGQATALGIRDKVEFVGRVAVSDMPATMAKGHMLVSASEFETFGVTLIEGMALGMPIVATRSGGPDSIVTPEVGMLIEQWDASVMAGAIQTIIHNIDRYKPADMRAHCKSRFSTTVVSNALKSIYSDVLDNGAG